MPLHQIEQYLDAIDLLLQTGYFSPAPQRER
jgi:hypothetical protein